MAVGTTNLEFLNVQAMGEGDGLWGRVADVIAWPSRACRCPAEQHETQGSGSYQRDSPCWR